MELLFFKIENKYSKYKIQGNRRLKLKFVTLNWYPADAMFLFFPRKLN